MKNEKLYLVRILEADARIRRHIGGDKEKFLQSELAYDAVIKVLSNLTESASKLEKSTKNTYPEIPWNLIAGLRNVLVHDYLGDLDAEEMWKVIHEDLPKLILVVRNILKEKYQLEL